MYMENKQTNKTHKNLHGKTQKTWVYGSAVIFRLVCNILFCYASWEDRDHF